MKQTAQKLVKMWVALTHSPVDNTKDKEMVIIVAHPNGRKHT